MAHAESLIRVTNPRDGRYVEGSKRWPTLPHDFHRLSLRAGDHALLQARGPDSEEVLEDLAALLRSASVPYLTTRHSDTYKRNLASATRHFYGHPRTLAQEEFSEFLDAYTEFLREMRRRR